MKCANIHNNLEDKEIRDMLSKVWTASNFGGSRDEVDRLRNLLEEVQQKLKLAEQAYAAKQLIDMKGWQLFDVSDDVEDYNKDCMMFVGTQQEKDQLFSN